MTYETENNITFHVIREKLCKFEYSRTLPMNVAIKNAHCGCERNLRIGLGRRCVESVVEYDKRQSIV